MRKKVCLSYDFSTSDFKQYIPDIVVLDNPRKIENYNLVIFPGGADVNPNEYHEANLYSQTDPYRDSWEKDIFNRAWQNDIRMLGICRGSQFLNVMLGGLLFQDIWKQAYGYHSSNHDLSFLNKEHFTYKYFGNKEVISTHHQAVKKIPDNGEIIATHNNIIEISAYKKYSKNLLMLQFHPEFEKNHEHIQSFFDYLMEEW